MTITTHQNPVEALNLISSELRALLIKDVRKTWPELSDDLGERGVNQMTAFLATSTRSEEPLTPSLRVDLFWHALVQRTVPYVAFSRALGVDYIHHVPDDDEGTDPEAGRAAMATTTAAIRAAGFTIDAEFWPDEGAADCSQCHAGCTDSPAGGKK
ncbi:hypothetical protein OG264_38880 (plasmid) [Streptomyces xanthophaeus]|uniref:hypothetical protein n=1 Tax=Streptomyces xanthophaeus TaxID=67385 RepID=UPI002F90E9DA|nr:hypothetical protein OG264_38880 [Streptomyces xanthophaeus]WST65861.1 hypothetical protein OG605_39875 [Streptomyces xanthophaeus]